MENSKIDLAGSIAYFISPHGFGHAARASAVMAAIHDVSSSIRFEIFTTVPEWFLRQSLSGPFTYHSLLTDIGMVQDNSLDENLPETLRKLRNFIPYDTSQTERLSEYFVKIRCQLIICDISPMGIAVARMANIPSVLIENFTWDWVYRNYLSTGFPVGRYIDYLSDIYESVNYHVQTEPVCRHVSADLTTLPVSRRTKISPLQIKEKSSIPDSAKVVMITMGGIPEKYTFLRKLSQHRNTYFIVPGGSQSMAFVDNLVLIPHHSDFYHPDLINACDAVIGKLGYSTLAEVYHAGIPYGYIPRSSFKESEILESFVKENISGYAIHETQFRDGSWISSLLPEILSLPKIKRSDLNGAVEAAQFVCKVLSNNKPISNNS